MPKPTTMSVDGQHAANSGESAKIAPEINVIEEVYADPGAALIAQATAKLGDKARNMRFFLGDGTKPAGYYERMGYAPVWTALSEAKEQWCDRGDPLYMIPEAKVEKQFRASSQLAREQARGAMNGLAEQYGARDADGVEHRLTRE